MDSSLLWQIAILGGFFLALKQIVGQLFEMLSRNFVATIDVNDKIAPEIYDWVLDFLGSQPFSQDFNKLQVTLHSQNKDRRHLLKNQPQELLFSPGNGLHFFKFNGYWIWVNLWKEESGKNEIWNSLESSASHSVQIRTFTKSQHEGRRVLESFILTAQQSVIEKRNNEINIYMMREWGASWKNQMQISKTPLKAVILPKGVREEIFSDIEAFFSRKDFYRERGIPHRRGYLFCGPPGSGKSTFVNAIASNFGLNIAVVSVTGTKLNDQSLLLLLSGAPPNAIILLEDIDCIFPDRAKQLEELRTVSPFKDDAPRPSITLSGVLNALDGVAAQEGRIVVMTSNYPERLDAALTRPGRVDRKFFFDYADAYQEENMFLKFYPDEPTLATEFAEALSAKENNLKISMAELQKYLLESSNCLSAARNAVDFFKELHNFELKIKTDRDEFVRLYLEEKEKKEEREELEKEEKERKKTERKKIREEKEKENKKDDKKDDEKGEEKNDTPNHNKSTNS